MGQTERKGSGLFEDQRSVVKRGLPIVWAANRAAAFGMPGLVSAEMTTLNVSSGLLTSPESPTSPGINYAAHEPHKTRNRKLDLFHFISLSLYLFGFSLPLPGPADFWSS